MDFEEEKGDISSLLQRQVARLRDEQNKLTGLLSNFLETGKENEILFSKIRSLVLQVLDADSHEMTKKVFESSLKKDFQIEACSLEFLDQKSLINLGDATKLNLLKSEVFTGTFNIKNLKTFFNSEKIKSAVVASFNYGEEKFGLIGGDIMHGQMSLDQMWAARPLMNYGNYRGPLKSLYMCGSGTHPGGGVTGLPGKNAAREILKDG